MTATCPVCGAPQDQGLLCHACTLCLERDLGDVAAIVADLDISLSRQARIGNSSGSGGLARERTPINVGAMQVADNLGNVLTTWARDLLETDNGRWTTQLAASLTPTVTASRALLLMIPTIRRHPAVNELVDEITDAIAQARRVVDRPANRTIIEVGPCPEQDEDGADCSGQVYAFIPTEDDRPSRMQCRADDAHKWTSIQFYRVGERIRRKMERGKKGAA